jgi:hypothetical protein
MRLSDGKKLQYTRDEIKKRDRKKRDDKQMLKLGHSILLKVTTFQQKHLEIIWCFHYKPTLIQKLRQCRKPKCASYAGDTRFETVLNQVLSIMFSHSPLVT